MRGLNQSINQSVNQSINFGGARQFARKYDIMYEKIIKCQICSKNIFLEFGDGAQMSHLPLVSYAFAYA